MKKIVMATVLASTSLAFSISYAESEAKAPQNSQDKIQQFVEQQQSQLSADFPYRINLFTQGQIIKNKYGVRIAETATQFPDDTLGQFFYYELLDESMRVPHWHANAVEVGTVLTGKMRVTIWEGVGKKQVFTVDKNNTWMIPQAALHSLENVGKDKLTFILAYNAPVTADVQFEQAWASLPNAILARSVGLTEDEIMTIKKSDINRLSGFDPSADPMSGELYNPFSSNFSTVEPIYQSTLGSIKRIDATNNTKMQEMAFQQTILKAGTLRLPHWYTAGDTFLYVASGSGFFTMLNRDGKTFNAMIKPGDLIFLPVGTFHGFLNTSKDDLVVYEAFNKAKGIQEISLLDGAQHLNIGAVAGAMDLNKTSISRVVNQAPVRYMISF